MPTDLAKAAKDKGIEYFLISFTDLFGVMRAKLVPASAIAGMQRDGAGFAGFAAWLDMTPADSDMFGIPDPESLIQLPWKPEVGWLAADLYLDGEEVAHAPRNTLKRVLADAADKGYRMKTRVEPEYFLSPAAGPDSPSPPHPPSLRRPLCKTRILPPFPRLSDVPERFHIPKMVSDRDLVQYMLAMRLYPPEAGFNLSPRETPELRDRLIPLGVTMMSAGSSTRPGGYATNGEEVLEQFAIEDHRSLEQVAAAIRNAGYDPVWKDFDRAFDDVAMAEEVR